MISRMSERSNAGSARKCWTQTCVSRINGLACSLVGIPDLSGGPDNVTQYLSGPSHAPEKALSPLGLRLWDQPGDPLPAFGDDNLFAGLVDRVHQLQTLGL